MRVIFVVAVIVVGIVAFFALANRYTRRHPRRLSSLDVARTIDSFLNSSDKAYAWDDFLTFPIADPSLEAMRQRCCQIDWNTESGREKLREELRVLTERTR
jgi:hypothetical protein